MEDDLIKADRLRLYYWGGGGGGVRGTGLGFSINVLLKAQ